MKLFLGFMIGMLFLLTGCFNSYEAKVIELYEFNNFLAVDGSLITVIEDEESIDTILTVLHSADRQSGAVDMVEGDYSMLLHTEDGEEEGIHLWLGEDGGSMMETADTHTLYTFSASSSKELMELFDMDNNF